MAPRFPRTLLSEEKRMMIRDLHLGRRWKQCISVCSEALSEAGEDLHPLHKTFLLFYLGISYESTARAQHTWSDSLLPDLDHAEQYLLQATQSLPIWEQDLLPTVYEHPPPCCDIGESSDSPTSYSNRSSLDSYESTSTAASSISLDPLTEFNYLYKGVVHKPPPQRIRPASTRPLALSDEDSALQLSTQRRITRYDSGVLHHYNAKLVEFESRLRNHMSSVRQYRAKIQMARQKVRSSSIENGSSVPCTGRSVSAEEKARRLRRGREMMWERPRFDARRYQGLCGQALLELTPLLTLKLRKSGQGGAM